MQTELAQFSVSQLLHLQRDTTCDLVGESIGNGERSAADAFPTLIEILRENRNDQRTIEAVRSMRRLCSDEQLAAPAISALRDFAKTADRAGRAFKIAVENLLTAPRHGTAAIVELISDPALTPNEWSSFADAVVKHAPQNTELLTSLMEKVPADRFTGHRKLLEHISTLGSGAFDILSADLGSEDRELILTCAGVGRAYPDVVVPKLLERARVGIADERDDAITILGYLNNSPEAVKAVVMLLSSELAKLRAPIVTERSTTDESSALDKPNFVKGLVLGAVRKGRAFLSGDSAKASDHSSEIAVSDAKPEAEDLLPLKHLLETLSFLSYPERERDPSGKDTMKRTDEVATAIAYFALPISIDAVAFLESRGDSEKVPYQAGEAIEKLWGNLLGTTGIPTVAPLLIELFNTAPLNTKSRVMSAFLSAHAHLDSEISEWELDPQESKNAALSLEAGRLRREELALPLAQLVFNEHKDPGVFLKKLDLSSYVNGRDDEIIGMALEALESSTDEWVRPRAFRVLAARAVEDARFHNYFERWLAPNSGLDKQRIVEALEEIGAVTDSSKQQHFDAIVTRLSLQDTDSKITYAALDAKRVLNPEKYPSRFAINVA